jgi:hypothetical protein
MRMPKPYHTPKSERDEAVGALTEAEEIEELRFSGEFIDANNQSSGYDFKARDWAQAIEKMKVEALMPPPEMGPVYGMMLYCFDDNGGWLELEVP